MKSIDKGTRITNYLIDIVVIYIIWFALVLFIERLLNFYFLIYIILFLYYFLMELLTGRTLGKLVTKTKVIHKSGKKPSFVHILMRSFWRLIPFDPISYLFGTEVGMHDKLSSTRIIKIDIDTSK